MCCCWNMGTIIYVLFEHQLSLACYTNHTCHSTPVIHFHSTWIHCTLIAPLLLVLFGSLIFCFARILYLLLWVYTFIVMIFLHFCLTYSMHTCVSLNKYNASFEVNAITWWGSWILISISPFSKQFDWWSLGFLIHLNWLTPNSKVSLSGGVSADPVARSHGRPYCWTLALRWEDMDWIEDLCTCRWGTREGSRQQHCSHLTWSVI